MATFVKQGLRTGSIVFVLAAGFFLSAASGQAVPTATKSAGLAVFGGVSEISPDYGHNQNYGFILGADFTRATRLFELAIEPRFGDTSGDAVTEKYFLGDVRFSRALGRRDKFHPYAFGGVGYGSFGYGSPVYSKDNSIIFAVGGGLDYDITSNFSARVEYQYQFWSLGYLDNGLTPHGFNGMVVYRIHSIPFMHRH